MAAVTYHCTLCDKRVEVAEGEKIPMCCDREMEPLPFCTTVQSNPEMVRNYDENEPCDPGTTPKNKKK